MREREIKKERGRERERERECEAAFSVSDSLMMKKKSEFKNFDKNIFYHNFFSRRRLRLELNEFCGQMFFLKL